MSGGGGQTTTQSSEPWSGIQGPLLSGYDAARSDILQRPTRYYPGQTVAGFEPQTEAALGAQTARAREGSGLLRSAQDYTQNILTDPTSTAAYDAILSDIRPGVDSAFSRAGRAGSGLHAEALGRGLGRAFAPYAERAAERAAPLAREDYYDIDRLGAVGATREAKGQQLLDADRARFEFGQNEPTMRILQYMQALSGVPGLGGTSTSNTQTSLDPLLTTAGIGLGTLGTAGGLGWTPLGPGGVAGK